MLGKAIELSKLSMDTIIKPKLPLNIRLMIGVISLPSLALAVMLGVVLYNGDYKSIGAFEVVYSAVGVLGLYIAVTGKRLF